MLITHSLRSHVPLIPRFLTPTRPPIAMYGRVGVVMQFVSLFVANDAGAAPVRRVPPVTVPAPTVTIACDDTSAGVVVVGLAAATESFFCLAACSEFDCLFGSQRQLDERPIVVDPESDVSRVCFGHLKNSRVSGKERMITPTAHRRRVARLATTPSDKSHSSRHRVRAVCFQCLA